MLKNIHPFDRKLPQISGRKFVEILCNKFDCYGTNIKGSHFTLYREETAFIVPIHPTVNIGTLDKILEKAGIDRNKFFEELSQFSKTTIKTPYGEIDYWTQPNSQ